MRNIIYYFFGLVLSVGNCFSQNINYVKHRVDSSVINSLSDFDTRHYRNNLSRLISYETLSFNQHTLSFCFSDDFESSIYVADVRIGAISIINKDYFNNDKFNIAIPISSIASLCGIVPTFEWGPTIDEYILMFLGSQHHFYLWYEPFTKAKQRPQWLSFFLKHNLEWYALRTHQWIDLSPGVGLCFHYVDEKESILDNRARFSIEIGYSREIATNFVSAKNLDNFYLNFRINGPIL